MRFVVSVHTPAHAHALRFTEAALAAGHEIGLVFFYQDGIRVADTADAQDAGGLWGKLSEQHSVPLAICIGAAARRGLVDESAPDDSARVRPGFDVVGLGQYIGALVEADRLITFADSP